MKICKHEMSELENCPSCYRHANTKKSTWFVEVCPKPHLLVWAKLKGKDLIRKSSMLTSSLPNDSSFFGVLSSEFFIEPMIEG